MRYLRYVTPRNCLRLRDWIWSSAYQSFPAMHYYWYRVFGCECDRRVVKTRLRYRRYR